MNKDDFSKQDYVLLAKLAQQTQRYDEMIQYVKKLLIAENQLTPAERNLCSSAYKNVVCNRRAELKVLQSLLQKSKQDKKMREAIIQYKQDVLIQMEKTCKQIIKIIDQQILPSKNQIKQMQSKVFYLKVKADYNRYLCQFNPDSQKYREIAKLCYEEADKLAKSNIAPTNSVRLALHLNMSVFLYEQENQIDRALQLSNRAFEQAIANIDTLNQQNYKDCTAILQLIRDNITLWGGDQ